jgi:hypothetical protein
MRVSACAHCRHLILGIVLHGPSSHSNVRAETTRTVENQYQLCLSLCPCPPARGRELRVRPARVRQSRPVAPATCHKPEANTERTCCYYSRASTTWFQIFRAAQKSSDSGGEFEGICVHHQPGKRAMVAKKGCVRVKICYRNAGQSLNQVDHTASTVEWVMEDAKRRRCSRQARP